mmetsp:Transcript_20082/g.22349  ORF Transcript_20082/g.22349 Transcript_20082/m.22349 type:complete len:172 (+) Transcript_20082:76-591(+)
MSEGNQVKLQSSDEETYDVSPEVAQMSTTIKNMLEDLDTDGDTAIPLPNVSGKILKKVIEYCNWHVEHPSANDETKKEGTDENKTDEDGKLTIVKWDKDFMNVEQEMLFELILAANYLDIKPLLDLGCKTVVNMMKGKSVEEIRKVFHIKNDFTPEEEAKVRKENEWCEEK